MASVNKVIIVGNLGRDPETRYMPDGAAITNVSVATSFQWNDKTSGEKKEETEWHRVVFRGKLAEIAGEYLKKGSQVYVGGRGAARRDARRRAAGGTACRRAQGRGGEKARGQVRRHGRRYSFLKSAI